jgi:hypothetical protein
MSALLLAASPWIIQTALKGGQADASTVAPAKQVQAASVPPQAPLVPPRGQVYGADNTNSRVTLRIHRPTRVTVNGRGGRLLFSRAVEAGDSYRAPSLPGLTVSADDAGAVEVVLNGTPAGFVGASGVSVQRVALARFASLAPRPAAPPTLPRVRAAPRSEPAPAAVPETETPVARVVPPSAPDQIEQVEAVEPPPVQDVAKAEVEVEAPAPPAPVQETPAPTETLASVPAPAAVEQQAVSTPPVAQPEPRRRLLDRLLPWRANRATAPAVEDPTAAILAPALTKEAADRAQAASDTAKAALESAERKAREENRRRNASFQNSARGISSPY